MNLARTCRTAVFACAAVLSAASFAQDVRPVFKLGYDFGGDTVVTAVFTNGSTKSIKANEGLFLGGGVSILNDAKNLQGEVTISYKFQSIDANNGSIDFTRYPLEALLFYRESQFRVGGGATYHLSPRVKGSGVVGGLNVDFKDALGVLLEADYLAGPKLAIGVRYTILDYKTAGGGKANSDGFGITFSFVF